MATPSSPMSKNRSDREYAKFKETPAGKTAVRVCVDDDTPIPIEDTGDINSFFAEDVLVIPDTAENTVLTHTVPVGKQFKLNNVYSSTSVDGVTRIKLDGTLIGIIRVGAGNKNGRFEWSPNRDAAAGQIITVTFESAGSTGPDIDVFLQGRQFDA